MNNLASKLNKYKLKNFNKLYNKIDNPKNKEKYIVEFDKFNARSCDFLIPSLDIKCVYEYDDICGGVIPPSNYVDKLGNTIWIRTHSSGWTIEGYIKEDWYIWIDIFTAYHPLYGKIEGDLNKEIIADSEEAYNHFIKNHPFKYWCPGDI